MSIKFQNQVSFVNLLLCTCTLSEWIFFILICLVKLFKNKFHNLRIKFVVVCLWLNDCAFFQSQTAEEELAKASAAFQKQQEINTQHTQKVSVVFEKADSLKVIFPFSIIFFVGVWELYLHLKVRVKLLRILSLCWWSELKKVLRSMRTCEISVLIE